MLVAQVRASKSPKPGTRIHIADDVSLEVVERRGDFHVLRLQPESADPGEMLEQHGHIPLPPYIDRSDENEDWERYQTVYARTPGAVAAPTAGLHFTDEVLSRISDKGVDIGHVTLHVGAGTFRPMRTENLDEHTMHSERFRIDEVLCGQIQECRRRGGRVVAVGTTVVRCLEAAATNEGIHPQQGETNIFIYPGYEFRVVDCLVTNFHLPESTLLMLVCAFAGTELVLNAYRHAVAERYRFFSYGDCMFITGSHTPSVNKLQVESGKYNSSGFAAGWPLPLPGLHSHVRTKAVGGPTSARININSRRGRRSHYQGFILVAERRLWEARPRAEYMVNMCDEI